MAWQKHGIAVPGEHGYCALAGKPEEIDKK
jgi:hypothetical protein